ncbi:MAG TPA: Wzz/FepE/Etk N-terminal domain-containing protein [Pyrinomonadaceae bacterium]|nr:Wzz/FepE/Etk N-terminal domain-containing protein [Pyrinomonadaceae bacterium]
MNFNQLIRILGARIGFIIATLLIVVGAALAVTLLMEEKYTAQASILVDYRGANPITNAILPVQLFSGYLTTQIDVIKSQSVTLKVVDELNLVEDEETRARYLPVELWRVVYNWAISGVKSTFPQWFKQGPSDSYEVKRYRIAEGLLKYLAVIPSKESNVLHIEYTAADGAAAETAANAFVRAYVKTNLEMDIKPAQQSSKWFDEQIESMHQALIKAQNEFSAYQRESGIILTDEHLDTETSRLTDLSSQLVMAQSQNHPAIQALKSELARSEARLNSLPPQYGSAHPQFQQAQQEVAQARAALSRDSGQVVAQIQGKTDAQRGRVLQMKKQRSQAAILQNNLENAQKAYDGAMQRFAQTRMESQIKQTNVSVINSAVAPKKPSSPNLPMNLGLAVFCGLMLSVGLTLLLEITNRTVRSAEDLRLTLGLPVLGVLAGPSGMRRPALAAPTQYLQLTERK